MLKSWFGYLPSDNFVIATVLEPHFKAMLWVVSATQTLIIIYFCEAAVEQLEEAAEE